MPELNVFNSVVVLVPLKPGSWIGHVPGESQVEIFISACTEVHPFSAPCYSAVCFKLAVFRRVTGTLNASTRGDFFECDEYFYGKNFILNSESKYLRLFISKTSICCKYPIFQKTMDCTRFLNFLWLDFVCSFQDYTFNFWWGNSMLKIFFFLNNIFIAGFRCCTWQGWSICNMEWKWKYGRCSRAIL